MTTRRPRRIASDEAHAWARNLRLGNPHAKLVLCMLAGYVNGEGSCFVSIGSLAEDCELVENTVRRRLGFLETIGAVAKTPQWIDESGRRNGEGRGRRTTDEIRLLLDADPEEIEARAQGGDSGGDSDAADPAPREGSDSDGDALGVHLPCTSVQGLTSEPEPEDSPQAPPSGGVPADKEISEGEGARWHQFKIGYPDGITDPIAAAGEFHKLTEPQQDQAIAAEPIYAARCRRRNEKPMKAHLFLRKHTFEGLLAAPPETPSLAGPYDPDSEAGKALLVLARISQRHMPQTGDGRLIYTRPITPQLLALAQAPRERTSYQSGTNNFGAWLEFLRAYVPNPPTVYQIEAPWPYPPSKEGKIYTSSTGPPKESLMTQEDHEHLKRTGTL